MDKIITDSDTSNRENHPNLSYTFNTINKPHDEIGEIEKTIKAHINWAVNNKDRATLFSTIIENKELYFIQTDSKSTLDGIDEFSSLINNVFMGKDFKAIRTEIKSLRIHISTTLQTSWFSCILNDYNEFQGKPFVWENVRWTGVLEKISGKWKIFQCHFSKAEDLIKT
ncbi:nuclear transport factor 2 family protein [Bacteroidota bacterium]